MKAKSAAPGSKVTAGALGGGAGVVIVWAWNSMIMPDNPMTAEIGAIVATAIGSAAAYLKQEIRLWRERS